MFLILVYKFFVIFVYLQENKLSDKSSSTKSRGGHRYTFQSAVRQIERRRIAEKLSKEAEQKEAYRLSELEAMRRYNFILFVSFYITSNVLLLFFFFYFSLELKKIFKENVLKKKHQYVNNGVCFH